jgi:hypothetical protein
MTKDCKHDLPIDVTQVLLLQAYGLLLLNATVPSSGIPQFSYPCCHHLASAVLTLKQSQSHFPK